MDLRKEFHDMIEGYGHHVLVHHTSRKIRCSCWNEKYQEPRSSCPYCFGRGWVGRMQRHKVRRETAANIISLPVRIISTAMGQVATDTMTFFMRHDSGVKVGDMIYEVGWDKSKPTHVMSAYEVNYVDDLRGDKGRVEFLQVAVKERNSSLKMKDVRVRRVGKLVNYELKREE